MGWFDSSKPVMMPNIPSSGTMAVTSLSKVSWPRSTHCKTAIATISLVQDAILIKVSLFKGLEGDWTLAEQLPMDFE